MLGAIRKLTENIEDTIEPKYKEVAVKNISMLHNNDGFITIAAKKGKDDRYFKGQS
ncbi:hypothetical protein [Clostridium taeniosporum]|uniref:hypothetical protein n=1 Tax=Clostridium taeniosporum TaxID=394958 RepID=UPI001864FDB2|nr:hypothetical protein [Clostridium taeniosporum]